MWGDARYRSLNRIAEIARAGERCSEALEHWEWDDVKPPLVIVGMGAGHASPIRSKCAWTHVLASEKSAKRWVSAQGECTEEWVKEITEGEGLAGEEARAKVRKSAMLARAEALWEASDALEGDGARRRAERGDVPVRSRVRAKRTTGDSERADGGRNAETRGPHGPRRVVGRRRGEGQGRRVKG